ncbi:MAG: GntR family transcriptional regulator [Bacillota bacterium]
MRARKDFVPVYYQLAEDIKRQIESGKLKEGDAIPSESQLVSEYRTSRVTVRRGLALLLEAGLIETVRGKGNFVAKPRFNQATLIFNEAGLTGEKKFRFKLLEVKLIKAGGEIASGFGIPEGTKIFMIKRLISGQDGPAGIDVKYLPYLKGKPLLEKEIEYADFPELVARHTDVMIHKIERIISAGSVAPEEAEMLKTAPGHPALCVTQLFYGKEDRLLGISRTVYRGEAFELKTVSYPFSGKM